MSHYFIRMLHDRGMLLRNYTQNIDTLERIAGLPGDKLVEAHGSFHTAHCIACKQEHEGAWVKERVFSHEIPRCDCGGLVKHDIVFFGEALPTRFYAQLTTDFEKCDALIVMGTSLKVAPFNTLVDQVENNVPRLLINMERAGVNPYMTGLGFDFAGTKHKYKRDALYLGDCDTGSLKLAELLGFGKQLQGLYESEHVRLNELQVKLPTEPKVATVLEALSPETKL
jgi:NAD-dependent deacetylase sirtuin 2